jgi:hypothetical protein
MKHFIQGVEPLFWKLGDGFGSASKCREDPDPDPPQRSDIQDPDPHHGSATLQATLMFSSFR